MHHPPTREISVTGIGKQIAMVDLVTVRLSVSRMSRYASAAHNLTNLATTQVLEVLKYENITDLHTSSIIVYPTYNYTDGVNVPNGFESTTSLSFDTNPETIGETIDNVLNVRDVRIDSVTGKLSQGKQTAVMPVVIRLAIDDAKYIYSTIPYGTSVSIQ